MYCDDGRVFVKERVLDGQTIRFLDRTDLEFIVPPGAPSAIRDDAVRAFNEIQGGKYEVISSHMSDRTVVRLIVSERNG